MKTTKLLIPLLLATLLTTACHKDKHFITDDDYRQQVHNDFLARQEIAAGRADKLFYGMDTLDCETREALEFLYAYMPYSDLADYDQAFYLQQIRAAFDARQHFSWGAKVPEDIFRHFVLVYRVNNENLDTARLLMQRELTPRLEGLSMYDAALEVNHWCHEYVAYRASDARTSAPLATMRTSLGRCGEESTFTVTALRSVGIPARQCYTPRWAHCDDNHAWVEVYIADSNRWFFLGACEPDAELDMGWFAVPSTRCMMVHSKAFGLYRGDEEVVRQTALFSELNLLSHYAPTTKATVTVFDADNKPVENADVKFKLYNYSEFYTLATIRTDADGKAALTTGLGDLKIWATDGTHYNYAMMDTRKQNNIEIYLTREGCAEYEESIDVAPPKAGTAKVVPDEDKDRRNTQRKDYEDSLRGAYMASFPSQHNYRTMLQLPDCDNTNISVDDFWPFIHKAEGNYHEIISFLQKHYCYSKGTSHIAEYLNSFSDKDLRDITADILEAHMTSFDDNSQIPWNVYVKGIMPARISNEMIRPWRHFLASEFGKLVAKDAEQIKQWTINNIHVDNIGNYYNCPLSPQGVYELRHSDPHSRDIFFVAACRAMAIPAYLDNATNTIYVWNNTVRDWETVSFDNKETIQPSATLTLTYKATKELARPLYWVHFSLAKYENGDFKSFDFEDDSRMNSFPATISLEPGYYCLTTGNRYPEGDVVAHEEYFVVGEGQKLTKPIVLRPLSARKSGNTVAIDPDQEIVAGMATLADYAGTTGMLFVFLGDYKEPSKHLIAEIKDHRVDFDNWGGMIYLVAPPAAKAASWKLPNTDCVMREARQKDPFETQITKALKLDLNNDYPLVALVNNRGEILFHSHGYSIGLAEQILKKTK